MNTAVIITGEMRTFATCVHTLRWQVLRHFPKPAFYVSTVKDAQAGSVEIIRELWPEAPLHVDVVEAQPTLPEPKEPVRFEPYERSVSVQAVLRQLWQLERGGKLWREKGRDEPVVLRVRPDLFFHSFALPVAKVEWIEAFDAFTPWWGRFGGINDRFAVLGRHAAEDYFGTYGKLERLMAAGCPLHPESLVAGSLWEGNATRRDTLRAEFSTLRMSGEAREPEISPIDLAHAGLS